MNRCPSEWYFQKFLEEVVHDSQLIPTIVEKEEGEHEQSTVDMLLEVFSPPPHVGNRTLSVPSARACAAALLLLLHRGAAMGKTRALLLALRHVRPCLGRVA